MEQINNLCSAIIERDLQQIEKILEEGININQIDKRGFAPIHYLHDYNINHDYYNLIFDKITNYPDVDLNIGTGTVGSTTKGRTLLHLTDSPQIVQKLLINHSSIDVDRCDNCGVSPLHFHVKIFVENPERHYHICKLLVEHGANVSNAQKAFIDLHKEIVECKVKYREPFRDEQMMRFMVNNMIDLPGLKPLAFIPILELQEDDITLKIYKKLDTMEYDEFIDQIVSNIFDYLKNYSLRVLKGIWNYIYLHRNKTTKAQYSKFFFWIRPTIFMFLFPDRREFDNFLDIYLENYNPEFNAFDMAQVLRTHLDCKALRRMINYQKYSPTITNTTYRGFLFIVTHTDYDINRFIDEMDPIRIRLLDMFIIARYCKLSKPIVEHFVINIEKDFFTRNYNIRNIEGTIDELLRTRDSPKSLLELSRNVIRRRIAEKYNATHPYEMDKVMDIIGVLSVYKKIINLETPLYPNIILPIFKHTTVPLVNPNIAGYLVEDGAEPSVYM